MATAAAGDVFFGSQAGSNFALEPVSAAVLCSRETKRRDAAKERGPLRVGCREVDEELLVGGFERGTVVGISAESEQMGLLISSQALARALCEQGGGQAGKENDARAMVVTTQPPATILPTLRDAIRAELRARGTAEAEVKSKLRGCLERVSVSRVFDIEGLWEVLGDLDIPPESVASQTSSVLDQQQQPDQEQRWKKEGGEEETGEAVQSPEPLSELPRHLTPEEQSERVVLPELKPARPTRTEIADSDEEDALSLSSELSSPPSSIRSLTPWAADSPERPASQDSRHEDTHEGTKDDAREEIPQVSPAQAENETPEEQSSEPGPPDIILATHFHSLMTALFTRHDRQSAHHSLQDLSAHLRYLARNLPSSPLIMLLNSTSSSKEGPASASRPANHQDGPPPPPNHGGVGGGSTSKPLDPTLRSIFNPPPLNFAGYGGNQAAPRRNRPTFGLVFSQLLDLHLLCTRIPKDKGDAEKLYALAPGAGAGAGGEGGGFTGAVRYVWAMEVLLDEVGVWEGGLPGGAVQARKLREQRWAAVDVKGGRVVDAFEAAEQRVGEASVVGGLGGPGV
ncbi:hypothetical protein LX32DRAFT_641629 [Colletotrichum zoysiae]|uniref:Uncharacterized protein n=1 Tax=Colletotrichum zoysiae TaxID=1216348 RepID=A0AAD9LZG8_9PEZI|nr:hypothetical protein LX32DRAFT_641629 [Colletotrichum zoysiae]